MAGNRRDPTFEGRDIVYSAWRHAAVHKRTSRELTHFTEYQACQFWSIVSTLTINKLHQAIDDASLQDNILCTATIYDSIYFIVRKNAATIKWLNNAVVSLLTKDFMQNQAIHNEAEGEIGPSWAELIGIPNNSDEQYIQKVINLFDYTVSKNLEITSLNKEELATLKNKFGV